MMPIEFRSTGQYTVRSLENGDRITFESRDALDMELASSGLDPETIFEIALIVGDAAYFGTATMVWQAGHWISSRSPQFVRSYFAAKR